MVVIKFGEEFLEVCWDGNDCGEETFKRRDDFLKGLHDPNAPPFNRVKYLLASFLVDRYDMSIVIFVFFC